MGEKRRLYSRSFERAAETSPADWAVAKKQSYTRRIDPEKSCKENHLREAHSCWTNRKKKKKLHDLTLRERKFALENSALHLSKISWSILISRTVHV